MKEKVLMIFSSGGGGLLQAAKAKEQEILKKNAGAKIIYKDLLLDWIGKPIGYLAVKKWDEAQRKGDIAKLEKIFGLQGLADVLFWPVVFFRMLRILIRENITRVIDTQPVSTGAILKAIRAYNKLKKKNVFLEKVIVDLPTDLNTHFFRPIKKLGKKDRKKLLMFTIDPLLQSGEDETNFWERNCRLKLENIVYQKYFIRSAFQKYQGKDACNQVIVLKTVCHTQVEKNMTLEVLAKRLFHPQQMDYGIDYNIQPEDRVYTILLGSQPAHIATLDYLKGFSKLAKDAKNHRKHFVFVFCSKHNNDQNSLFKAVRDFSLKNEEQLKNLIIIPLSFQTEDVIAPIFYRSDVTFTRSGGQTAMELLGVMKGKIFIHSETKNEPSRENLLKGMFGWESGNGLYLESKRGAKIVTPRTFPRYLEKYFNFQ